MIYVLVKGFIDIVVEVLFANKEKDLSMVLPVWQLVLRELIGRIISLDVQQIQAILDNFEKYGNQRKSVILSAGLTLANDQQIFQAYVF